MGTRAAGVTKKPEIVKAAFASVSASDVIRAPVPLKAVPLTIAPLLIPFKRRGRLSLRIERVPQQARLSHGQNNGDGSWSLSPDDLDDLTYIIPETLKQPHNLSLRVMATEGGDVTTLKVLELPVSPDAPQPETAEAQAMDWGDLAQLRRLEEELTQMRALLETRDGELAESRTQVEGARGELQKFEAALVAAQAGSKSELDQRTTSAAAQAARELEQARSAWQADENARAAKLQAEAERRLADARALWQHESAATFAKAEADWKAEETARLAAAETQRREQSARALAEAKTQREAAEAALAEVRKRADTVSGTEKIELSHLRKEVTAAQTALITREGELAKLRTDNEQARQRWQKELETSLADLRTAWTADEAARLNAAEARWRAKSDAALAQAAARSEAAEAALAEAHARAGTTSGESGAEMSRLRKELAKAQVALIAHEKELAVRQSELAAQRAETEQVHAARQQQSESALSAAKAAWKTEEAARLAAAEAKWRQQSAASLAEATERYEDAERELAQARSGQENQPSLADARKAWKADEAARLAAAETKWRQQSAASLAEATERCEDAERALAQVRSDHQNEPSLAEARKAWKADEAAHFAAAEAKWRQQSAEATERCEAAEHALAEARKDSIARPADDAYVNRLRGELTALQGVLVAREAELAHARAAADQPRQYWPQTAAQQSVGWEAGGPEEQSVRRANLRLIRDVIIVVALVMTLILCWPRLVSVMPDSWRQSIANLLPGSVPGVDNSAPAAAPATAAPAAAAATQETAIVAKSVNVRSAPSASAPVVAKLPRDAEVAVFERQGKWTSVGTPAQDGKPAQQQGWVFSSYLKSAGDPPPPSETPAPAAPKPAAAIPARARPAAAPASVAATPTPAPAEAEPTPVATAPAVAAPAPAAADTGPPQ